MSEARQLDFAIVAALEREVKGLVGGWKRESIGPASSPVYRSERAVLICAGTGRHRAYKAARLLIENFSPRLVISLGFAGSCTAKLEGGELMVPARVVEAASGDEFHCSTGSGVLVTADAVAGRAAKQELATRFRGEERLAVDMEAAGVARAAMEQGLEFAAIRAISDVAGEEMDFLASFTTPEGFATARFAAYIAVRPWRWKAVAALARTSRLAAGSMAEAILQALDDWQGFCCKHQSAASGVNLIEE